MFCKNCGKEYGANALYCLKCGKNPAEGDNYCFNCGAEISGNQVCPQCGALQNASDNQDGNSNILQLLTKILLIFTLSIILVGFLVCFIIGLATINVPLILYSFAILMGLVWCLPMTIVLLRKLKNHEKIGLALKICTLIFVNLLAGCLLLIDKKA